MDDRTKAIRTKLDMLLCHMSSFWRIWRASEAAEQGHGNRLPTAPFDVESC